MSLCLGDGVTYSRQSLLTSINLNKIITYIHAHMPAQCGQYYLIVAPYLEDYRFDNLDN